MHGGGYVVGSYDSDDELFAAWCPRLGVAGVSVEYRLAPEVPYPGPLEDCYAALTWTVQNAAELGIDPARVGVRGVSAGGGLAAGLALLARDRGEVTLAFQALDCPMLDDRQDTPSINAAGLYVWTRDHNDLGWRSYLGALHGGDGIPGWAVPARAADLAGLPPACIVVGAIDGFRDECVDYAQRLSQAGVGCELHVIAGLPHGYQQAPQAAAVRQARRDLEDWLARQLNPASPGGSAGGSAGGADGEGTR
jgi:acetyl esterase/lipase